MTDRKFVEVRSKDVPRDVDVAELLEAKAGEGWRAIGDWAAIYNHKEQAWVFSGNVERVTAV